MLRTFLLLLFCKTPHTSHKNRDASVDSSSLGGFFLSCKCLHNINQSKIFIVLNVLGGLEQVNHRDVCVCVICRLVAYHLLYWFICVEMFLFMFLSLSIKNFP